MNDSRYTVLGRADAYREDTTIGRGGGPVKPPRTFQQARELLLPQLDRVASQVGQLAATERLDEVVFEVRLHPQYSAKSHYPTELLANSGLTLRGSGLWRGTRDDRAAIEGRSLFVSGKDGALNNVRSALDSRLGGKGVRADLVKLEEIHLPSPAERIRVTPPDDGRLIPIELVLYNWDRRHRGESVDTIVTLLKARGTREADVLVRTYNNGPAFIAATLPASGLQALENLNFLRVARSLPRVALTRTLAGTETPAPSLPAFTAMPTPRIAVFDAGFANEHPYLTPFVRVRDLTHKASFPEGDEHGTAVCSAALYGHIAPGSTLRAPQCQVLAFRVLPDSRSDELELYGVIDALEAEIPKLGPEIKVVNLSLGPEGPIDDVPSRFTFALDRLAYEHDKLFFVAVGNWGEREGECRIQSPSDCVNGIGVGAYELEPGTASRKVAGYSCPGPGRTGCSTKPDLVGFGGSIAAPFFALTPTGNLIGGTRGTSFSTPVAASLAAELLGRTTAGVSTQAVRALLIDRALPSEDEFSKVGWGILPSSAEDVIECGANDVTILYEGTLSPRMSWRLPFLLPTGFTSNSKVFFDWTIVYAPDVDPSAADEYTLAGLELQFRPNARKFTFWRPDQRKTWRVSLDDVQKVAELKAEGWRQSKQPAPDGGGQKDERRLRASEAKWDTVVRGQRRKVSRSVFDPALTISMVGRGSWQGDQLTPQARYAAVLRVRIADRSTDLYALTLSSFPKLKALQLRSRIEIENRPST